MQERWRSWSVVRAWTSCRQVSMHHLSHWSGQQQHLLQCLQALGAQEMQWTQALDKGPWLQTYMVPGNCTSLEQQTTEGSPGRTWQARGGSFCYLGDMLSAAGGCELSTTTCVKMPGRCGHVYSSCVHSAMLHASETWPLTKPNLKHLQQNDRAMIRQICNVRPQDIVTIRSNELLARFGIEDLDLILKERRLRCYGHVECSNGAVKTAFYKQVEKSVVLGGPRWHGSSGQTGFAETRSSRLLTLMIDICGDLGWDLPCVQQASSLEVGPLMWMLQHVNPCPAEPRYALPLQTV